MRDYAVCTICEGEGIIHCSYPIDTKYENNFDAHIQTHIMKGEIANVPERPTVHTSNPVDLSPSRRIRRNRGR